MEFWISQENEKLRLAIPPSEFNISHDSQNTIVNVNNIGQVNLLGNKTLKGISFSSTFPSQIYDFCQYKTFPMPWECVNMILKYKNSGKPINLKITGTNINEQYSIESFNYGEKAGSSDVEFSIELKEYKLQSQNTSSASTSKRTAKTVTKSYTVKSGDTLSIIAKKTTGNSANWKKIASINNIKNPSSLKVGQRLVIA